jgi:hypothetical protein
MLVKMRQKGYSSQRKYIRGRGFMDTMKNIGSYIYQNKDLIAKPLLGAVGDLGAMALTEGSKAILTRLMNKKNEPIKLDAKAVDILQNLSHPSVGNIIGSGIKQF